MNITNLENFIAFKQLGIGINSQSISVRVSNTENTKESKPSKYDRGCSLSISGESKALLKQLSERENDKAKPQPENRRFDARFNDTKKVQSTRIYANESIELQSRLIGGFYQFDAETKYVGFPDFNVLEDTYNKLGKELESKYTGTELDNKLNMLDEEYGNVLTHIFDDIKSAINYGKDRNGKEGMAKAIEHMFGYEISDLGSIIADIDPERFQPFSDAINELVDYLTQMKEELKELYISDEQEKESSEIEEESSHQPMDALAEYLAKMKRESADEAETLIEILNQGEEESTKDNSAKE